MSEKQLWRVNWSGGQTDGDVGQNTVRDLLNVELDTPGRLAPRDSINAGSPYSDSTTICRMHSDPTGAGTQGWDIELHATLIKISEVGNSGNSTSIPLPIHPISPASEIVVYGDVVFVAAINGAGLPMGCFTVSYSVSGSRFSWPQYHRNSLYGQCEEDHTVAAWVVRKVESPEATLAAYALADVDSVELSQYLSGSSKVAMLFQTVESAQSEVDVYGALGDAGGVQYRVQFRYSDGQMSKPSNIVDRSVVADADKKGLAWTIGLSASLDSTVDSVNVYRKIHSRDVDTEWELIANIPVTEKALDAQREVVGGVFGERLFLNGDTTCNDSMLRTYSGGYQEALDIDVTVSFYAGSKDNPTAANLSSGWTRIGAGNWYLFHAAHYSAEGELVVRAEIGAPQAGWYECRYPCAMALDVKDGVPCGSYIIGGPTNYFRLPRAGSNPAGYLCYKKLYPTVTDLALSPELLRGMVWRGFGDEATATAYYAPLDLNYPLTSWGGVPPSSLNINGLFSLFYDIGRPGLLTLDDVMGGSEQELVTLRPRHFAVVAGRLVMLNTVDGEDRDRKALLSWSNFRKYYTFMETSYNDHSMKDDGEGVGIAVYGSRMLALHTMSAYAMDISGGSDMSWRGVGEWPNVGCLHNKAFVETPFGVFFCDRDRVYHWNGEGLNDITVDEASGRSVLVAYRAISGSIDSIVYRPSKHQVWVCSGRTVLVHDIASGSWHRHQLDELPANAKIVKMDSVDNHDRLHVLAGAVYSLHGFSDETVPGFTWGLSTGDIAMGVEEMVKKLKRVYLDLRDELLSPFMTVQTNNGPVAQVTESGNGVKRVSQSVRGYGLDITLSVPVEHAWRGTLNEVGLVFKAKPLK